MVNSSVRNDVEYWEAIRKTISRPIWLMGYKRDLLDTGFYKCCKMRIMDALVIPDISFKDRLKLSDELEGYGVDIVGFVNPEMKDLNWSNAFLQRLLFISSFIMEERVCRWYQMAMPKYWQARNLTIPKFLPDLALVLQNGLASGFRRI